MAKGNYTEAFVDVAIAKIPEEYSRSSKSPRHSFMFMGEDNIGRVTNITSKDAKRLKSKINKFKQEMKLEFTRLSNKEGK